MASNRKKLVMPSEPVQDIAGQLFGSADRLFALIHGGDPERRAPAEEQEKAGGREYAVQGTYRLYPSQHAWLKAQAGGGSAKLRELVSQVMEAEHAAETD